MLFKGGEKAAAKRLEHYFWKEDRLKNYKFTRNGLLGADYSSKFSPWLANGSLSPRKIYRQVKQYEQERKKNVSTYRMVFELIWRDYFHFSYLRHGTDFFKSGGIQQKERNWKTDRELFNRWANAEIGIPFIDAWLFLDTIYTHLKPTAKLVIRSINNNSLFKVNVLGDCSCLSND